ncbi:hypothetical protein RJ639_047565 [Escallonia herrerae]|uniref:UDP-glycosyltransferase n=1 Tax=Escallonia herrerae TaxID=1293975 RepID=A0AA88W3G4_9ASTE|nr:hypothetical protein RJ639_047565 [Escallonia herrerae]
MPPERKQNIVMFPFMAQGHIIPFLGLALKLEKEKGFKVTFINTPLNIKRLQPSIPPNSSIHLLEIPFNSSHLGPPPNAENTETLALDLMLRLIESSPSLKPAFEELICTLVNEQNGQPPLCIISDMFFGWSAEVAHKFGVFHAIFNAGGGYGMAVFHTTWLNLPHKTTTDADSNDFPLPGFPKNYRFKSQNLPGHQKAITGPWYFGLEMFQEWLETDAMLFNTVEEIDHIEKGKDMKRKACEAEETIKSASKDKKGFKGSSVKAVDEFLDAALQSWNRLQRSQEMLCTL